MLKNDQPLLRSIFSQLIEATSAMHNVAGFAHMDIKLENILVSNEGHIKLCDFGFSTYASGQVAKKLGTEAYMAPEIHTARSAPCDPKKADIFSLGILFFILAFGAPPFHSAQLSDTYFRFLKLRPGSLEFFKFHPHTKILYKEGLISLPLMQMLIEMLSADPNTRIGQIDDLRQNDFINGKQFDQQSNFSL